MLLKSMVTLNFDDKIHDIHLCICVVYSVLCHGVVFMFYFNQLLCCCNENGNRTHYQQIQTQAKL